MDDSTQDPFAPLQELKKPNNIFSMVKRIQSALQPGDSATLINLDEIVSESTGTLIVDELIAPAPDVTVTDPTDTTFYGAGVTGGGRTFGSLVMNFWAVAAGVLQVGFNNLGKLIAGAGAVVLDALGITLLATASYVSSAALKISDGTDDFIKFYGLTNAGIRQANFFINGVAGKTVGISNIIDPVTVGDAARWQANVGGIALISMEKDTSEVYGTYINANNEDVDTLIKGMIDDNLIRADASTDRVGIGTATPAEKLDVVGNILASGTITGSNISGTNTGDITLAAVGAAPSANGATLSGQVLTLQPADATRPGVVTAGTQTFGGVKTLTSPVLVTPALGVATATSLTTTGAVSVGTFLNIPTVGTLTIATGAITVTGSRHLVDTEAAAATDDLDTISGGSTGDVLILSSVSSVRDTTVKNGTGNINCGADRLLSSTADMITLIKMASGSWNMLSFADNA